MLREEVYNYLWKQIKNKLFIPGEFIDLNSIAKKLNVSRTPLREALIVLESEGFVKILPKKGIYINPLTLQDTYNIYETIGAFESSIVYNEWDKINSDIINTLEDLNDKLAKCVDYEQHYNVNHEFHFAYINLSQNAEIVEYLSRQYRRIYDFSGINYGSQFQINNVNGHKEFIQLLKQGKRVESADYLRDYHWKFRVPEIFVR